MGLQVDRLGAGSMSDLTISTVPPNLIDVMWSKLRPHLELVIDRAPDEVSLETVKAKLKKGDAMIITISDGETVVAVNTLEVQIFETGHKVLFIPMTGGERMEEWLDRFLDMAHAVARDLKCHELRGMACRKGWLRTLKPHDWYELHAVIGCKVKPAGEASQ